MKTAEGTLLALVHLNGDRRLLSVTSASRWLTKSKQGPCLLLWWPLAGEYTLDLLHNRLVTASKKNRPPSLWAAEDIEGAWHLWVRLAEGREKDKWDCVPKLFHKKSP